VPPVSACYLPLVAVLTLIVCGGRVYPAAAQLPPTADTPTAAPTAPPTSVPTPARPTYDVRGEAVEARHRAYKDRLQRYYDALCARVKADAPDLYAELEKVPPKPVVYGYQLLPKLVPPPTPAPTPSARPRATSKWYTWPWTEQKIDAEMKKLDGFTANLERIPTLAPTARRPVYEKLVTEYKGLTDAQRNIDDHVQYNRTWQREIFRLRPAYDTGTHLHDAVLERQAVLDALDAKDDAAFRAALEGVTGVDRTQPRTALEPALRAREAALATEIHDVIDKITPPKHLRVERRTPHLWVVHVPFVTDIDDTEFARGVRHAIESIWHVRDGDDEFRVDVSFTYISPDELYRRRPGCERDGRSADCRPPQKGDKIDVGKHVGRFPPGTAVLTTGSNMTYAWGSAIVLGPQDAGPHLLAHEFGHMIGFRDEYFRGYRDLGADGFRVMEVVAEPDDVMGDPGDGPVRRRQFEKLIAAAPGSPTATASRAGE